MQMTKHSVRSLIVDFSSSLRSLNIASHAYSCCAFTADYPKHKGIVHAWAMILPSLLDKAQSSWYICQLSLLSSWNAKVKTYRTAFRCCWPGGWWRRRGWGRRWWGRVVFEVIDNARTGALSARFAGRIGLAAGISHRTC